MSTDVLVATIGRRPWKADLRVWGIGVARCRRSGFHPRRAMPGQTRMPVPVSNIHAREAA